MRLLFAPTMAALVSLTTAQGAAAQYAPQAAPPPAASSSAVPPVAPAGPPPECQAGITKGIRAALLDLQNAVIAKDSANIPAKLATARGLAKSGDDRCFIALLEVKAAMDAKDLSAVAPALEAQLASGSVPPAKIANRFEALGRAHYEAKAYAAAAANFERALALSPGRGDAVVMLAETRAKENRASDAIPLYQKAIALEKAAGRPVDETWYKRAIAVAYEARNPVVFGLSRDWVAAFPSPKNWRDSVGVYGLVSKAGNDTMVDLWRLQRLTKSLQGESDHAVYAEELITRGYAGEAQAVLNEGIASGAVDRNRASIKTLLAMAATKSAGDRASLDGQSSAALASPGAKQALVLADAYYGYGEYAKAIAMYRAALGKAGVDADLANLRLGMALAASGDKAGAAAVLAKVSGPRAEVARFWGTYAAIRG